MNEQAIIDSYNLFASRGYNGSIDNFKQLIASNPDALNDSYDIFKTQGYSDDIESYKELMGLKKKETEAPEWTLTQQTQAAQGMARRKMEQQQAAQQPAAPTPSTAPAAMESSLGASSLASPSAEERGLTLLTPEKSKQMAQEAVTGTYMGSQKAAPVMKVEALPVSAPSKSEADFSSSLEEVNKDLMDYDEDYIVPKLDYLFGKNKYNFEFNWYRDGKEAIEVKAPNGKKTVIPVDAWTEKGDIESAEAFKKFLNENKPKLAKLSDEYNIYQSTIKNEQDMKKATESMNAETMQLNKIQQDLVLENNNLDKELKYLQSVPQSERGSQDYINRLEQFNKQREDFSARLGNASQMEKDVTMKQNQLYTSIGRYTSMRAEQGGFFGGLYNSLLGGYSSMGAAATGIATDVIMSLPLELTSSPKDIQDTFTMVASSKGIEVPANMDYEKFKQWSQTLDEDTKSEINSEVKDYLTKRTKGEMLPSIRKGLTETIGAKGTTPEYIQDAGLIKGGIYGLAASLPAMSFAGAGPAGTMSAFFLQGYDATMKEMESEEFKDVSENEKYLVALPVGIVSAVLEEFGMRNVLGKSGLVNDIVAKALSKSGAGTTATTFKQLVENEIESRVARGALVLTAAGLSEAETGAAQAAVEIGIKELYNTVKGKDMFKTPETVGEFVKEVAIAGAQEAIGGVVMGSFNAVGTAYGENNFDGVTNETLDIYSKLANDDNARSAYAVDLKIKIVKGEITPEQGKKALDDLNNSISVFNSIPDGLAPAQQRQAFSLLRERKGLEAEIQGKDEAMVKKQKARIAEINSELEKVSEMKEEAPSEAPSVAPSEAKPLELEKGNEIKWNVFGNEPESTWTVGEKVKTRGGEDAVELSAVYVESSADGTSYTKEYADANNIKYDNERTVTHIVPLTDLQTLKTTQDAIQKQAAGQVPVQPTARPSEEVAQGEPQAEPQVTAQAGVEEEIADIERRRQEELNTVGKGSDGKFYSNDGKKFISGVSKEDVINQLNAKYDAELAALGATPAPTAQAGVEEEVSRLEQAFGGEFAPVSDKKADIERRRQKELDSNPTMESLIKVGNIINYNGNKVKISEVNRFGDGGIVIGENVGVLNIDLRDSDSYILYQNGKKSEQEINAKYDAELAALGTSPAQPAATNKKRNLSAEEIKNLGKDPKVRSIGKLEGGPLATEGGLPGVGGITKVFRTKGTGLGKLGIAYRGSGVYYAIDKPFQVIGTQGEVSEVEVDIDSEKTIDLTTKEGQKIFGNIQNEAKKRFDALPQSSRNINTVNDLIRDIALEKGYTGAVSWIEPGAPSNEKLRIGREYVSYKGNAEITPAQAKSIGKLRNMKLSGQERIKMEDAAARLAKILPSWISVEEMAPLLENWREGRVTFGSFYNNIIKLSRLAPKGTELHEAFHAVFRTLLTDKQQDGLYKEAKDMMIRDLKKQGKSFIQGFAQFKKDRPDYTEMEDMTDKQLKSLYIEEWMADEFARQSKSALAKKQQAPKSGLASLWEKFIDLINRMVRFFTGQKQLTRLFADIEAGRFKAAEKPVLNRFSKNPELNIEARSEIFTGYEIKPNGDVQATFLDPTYEQRFVNTIASKVWARINNPEVKDRNVTADEMMNEELAALGQFFSPENNPEVDYDNPDPSIEDRVALLGNFDFVFNGQSEDAIKSRSKLKNEIRLKLKEFNIDEFDSAADEGYDGSEDNATERSFDLNNENKGGFTSLSKTLRKYISTTSYTTTLDEFLGLEPGTLFGAREITTTVDPQKVYNGIVKMAANQADPRAVLRKMHYYARTKGESAVFINKFFEEVGMTFDDNGDFTFDSSKKPLVQRVVKAFNLYEVDYLFTALDTKNLSSRTYSANRRSVDKIQTDVWQDNYVLLMKRRGVEELKRRAGELNLNVITTNVMSKFTTPDGKIKEEPRPMTETEVMDVILGRPDGSIIGLKQKFAGIGISLSEQYLRYIVLSATGKVRTADQERFVMEFQSSVKMTAEVFKKSMDVVTQLMEEGKNPYIRGTKLTGDTEGALTKLMNIAKDNAVFDETVVMSTINNAEGKNIYPYQKATYHIQKFFELQGIDLSDPDVLEQIQSEKPNSDFLIGNRLLNNEVFQALLPNLKIERIDGVRQQELDENLKGKMNTKNAEGVTYGKMSPRELALTMYTLFTDNSTDSVRPVTTDQGKVEYVKTRVRRFLFNVMEASNTADTVRLPVSNLIDENEKITQEFKDAYFAEIKREYDRIQRVRNGEYADQYNKFNAFTEKEEDQRGRQFWDTKEFLDSIDPTGMLRRQLQSGEVTLEEVTPQIMAGMDKYFREELLANIEKLKELGIIKEDNTNRLLPKVYEGGIADDPLFSSKSLLRNISNVYLNDLLNSMSINQILMGDPAMGLKNNVDWFKRARGNNASGDNMLGIDPNQNAKPVRMVTIGRINEKGELDDFYNEEYKLSTRIYQIGSAEYEKFRQGLTEEERAAFDKEKPKQIAVADAQAYTTVNGMMGFLDSLGRLSDKAREIYGRIAKGKRISPEDWKILKDDNVMLNSQKLVYYDGVTYVKMSVAVLSPEYTSDSNGNPRPGMEFLDNLRKDMEAKNIEMVGPPSMMKKMIKNPYIADPVNPSFDMEESNVQLLDRGYLRLQQENPSNKTQIKDPTQQQNIITAEQTNAEIDFPFTREGDKPVKTGKDLVNWYDGRLAERVRTTMIPARNFLLTLKDNKWTLNMKRATKVFKKILEETGASAQVLSYLEVDENGNPQNLNAPNIVKEFEQHFNAYFNKVLSQKVPGYKTTLQSGFMHRVLEDTETGRIISTVEYDADPSKYADRKRYVPRRLKFDQPRIVNGKEVHRYSEVVIPFHFAEQFNLKPGDQIPEEIAYLFGTRIPSQDKHSAMALKIVDVLPPHAGSNMIAPDELIILTGSDFDVDSFFIQRPGHYFKDGRFMVYGNNEDSKWEQFKTWHYNENRLVKDVMDEMETELLQSQGAKEDETFERIQKAALRKVRDAERADALVSELGMAGEGYDALTETDKELVAQLPTLREDYKRSLKIVETLRQSLLIKALKELGLPSTEQEFKTMGIRSIGEINNDLLNARMVLHSNPTMNNINKTPATLTPVENSLERLASDYGYGSWREMETKRSPNSILGKLEAFETNKAGQVAIGAAVNNTNNYTIISRFGIQAREDADVQKVVVNGQEVGSISNTVFTTRDAKRIMDVLSSLTSSMTDNTKYGYNSKLNLDIDTLSVVSLLTMNQVGIYDAIRLINSQYVVKYKNETQQYAIQSETEENKKREVGDDLVGELIGLAAKASGGTRTGKEINLEGKGPVTNDDLVLVTRLNPMSKAIVGKTIAEKKAFYEGIDPQELYNYYMAELRILNSYLTLSTKHGPEFIAFSQIVKLTKGISSSTKETSFKGDEELRRYLEQLNLKLVETKDGWRVENGDAKKEDLPLYDFKDILNKHLISLENLKVFAVKSEAQKSYFISQSAFAEKLRNKLNKGLKKRMKNKVRSKAMTQIRRDIESFLMTRAWRNSLPENERENLNNYLFPDIAKKNGTMSLLEIKQAILNQNPHLDKNLVLMQVFFKEEMEGLLSKIETNTRTKGNKGFEGMVLTAMRTLANNEGYPIVNAMIKHLIAKNGLQFKNDSPVGLFSPGIYGNEFPFSQLMDEYTSVLNTGTDEDFKRIFGKTADELMDEFQELFMLDINNRDFITRIYKDGTISDEALKQVPKGITSPITKTDTGFTVDFDKGIRNIKNEALYDDDGNLVETLDTTEDDKKQRGYNFAKMKTFQFDRRTQVLKKENEKERTVTVFNFPEFIQVGFVKYKLKQYVPAATRYKKDEAERFTTKPDEDGNYMGIAATYEMVPTLGYWGVSVIGRTIEEARERTFDDMMELKKKAEGGEQSAVRDSEEAEMNDEYLDYAATTSNIPAAPVQVVGTTAPVKSDNPATWKKGDKIVITVSARRNSEYVTEILDIFTDNDVTYSIKYKSSSGEVIQINIDKNGVFSERFDYEYGIFRYVRLADTSTPSMSKQDQLVQKNIQNAVGTSVTAGEADTNAKDLLIFSLVSKGRAAVIKLYTNLYAKAGMDLNKLPAIFAKLSRSGIFYAKGATEQEFKEVVEKIVKESSPAEVSEMNQKLC